MRDRLVFGAQFVSPALFPVSLVSESRHRPPNIGGGAKRREDGTEYRVLRQQGARVTWRSVNYDTVDCATVLDRNYIDSVDNVRHDPDVEDSSRQRRLK